MNELQRLDIEIEIDRASYEIKRLKRDILQRQQDIDRMKEHIKLQEKIIADKQELLK